MSTDVPPPQTVLLRGRPVPTVISFLGSGPSGEEGARRHKILAQGLIGQVTAVPVEEVEEWHRIVAACFVLVGEPGTAGWVLASGYPTPVVVVYSPSGTAWEAVSEEHREAIGVLRTVSAAAVHVVDGSLMVEDTLTLRVGASEWDTLFPMLSQKAYVSAYSRPTATGERMFQAHLGFEVLASIAGKPPGDMHYIVDEPDPEAQKRILATLTPDGVSA